MKRIQIIDSTTITLFSNLLFKGVGRHPKTGNLRYNIMEDCMYQTKEGFFNSCKFNFVDRWFGKTET